MIKTYEDLDLYCVMKYICGLDYFVFYNLVISLPTIRNYYFRCNSGLCNRVETIFIDGRGSCEDLLAGIVATFVKKFYNKRFSFFVVDRVNITKQDDNKLKVDLIFKGKK